MGGIVNAIFGGGQSAPPPPDYTPVANASKEAAELGDKLARDQMAESKRQYEETKEITKPIVDAQLETMRQTNEQGKDYYEYGKSFRPVEQKMAADVMADDGSKDAAERAKIEAQAKANAETLRTGSDEFERKTGAAADALAGKSAAYQGEAARDIATYTGGNSAIMQKYGADIEGDVGTAMADARAGQSQATNQAIRQALRYGLNVPAAVGGLSTDQASQIASSANNTRTNSINSYRNIVGQGIGMKKDAFVTGQAADADALAVKKAAFDTGQAGRTDYANRTDAAVTADRNQRIQDTSLNWAKKLDVTGMARGMPGASQGAYSIATGAGNSATQNQMAPGQALVNSMGQSNGTALNGRQIALSGLNGVLNSQTSYVNNAADNATKQRQQNMDVIGGSIGAIFKPSDIRLKKNIVKLSDDERGFGWYQFEYLWGGKRHTGVMAQEVAKVIPAAVKRIGDFLVVDYSALQGALA